MDMQKMNIIRIYAALGTLVLISIFSQFSEAETMRITGRLVSSACNLSIMNPSPLNISLGRNISSAQLNAADASKAMSTPVRFSLVLTNCPPATTRVMARLNGTPDANDHTLYAVSGSKGMASGVGILVTDRDHSNAVLNNNSTSTVAVNNGTAYFNWQASVKRSSFPVSVGAVNATVLVNITYP
ncbi:hypothetical protein VL10_14595 [Leclercia adecarboxylata]|nr:hypothetical protein VL10_14595 [Leclercia adecarboxylata]KMN63741.1 hypothetical protein VK95_18825 [Leclercia sp. LK8]